MNNNPTTQNSKFSIENDTKMCKYDIKVIILILRLNRIVVFKLLNKKFVQQKNSPAFSDYHVKTPVSKNCLRS